MENYNHFIRLCQLLGKHAAAKGEQAAGAIITLNNVIVSEAEEATINKNDITCHAEIEAIRLATRKLNTTDLSGCVLFSTHEPCIMCSYAIRFYKIKKVIYRQRVNSLGGVSSTMPLLTTTDVPAHWTAPPQIIHMGNEEQSLEG